MNMPVQNGRHSQPDPPVLAAIFLALAVLMWRQADRLLENFHLKLHQPCPTDAADRASSFAPPVLQVMRRREKWPPVIS